MKDNGRQEEPWWPRRCCADRSTPGEAEKQKYYESRHRYADDRLAASGS
jgi:hypothetical protein